MWCFSLSDYHICLVKKIQACKLFTASTFIKFSHRSRSCFDTSHTKLYDDRKYLINKQSQIGFLTQTDDDNNRRSLLCCSLRQTGREFCEETNSNHCGVNPPDLSCLRRDLSTLWPTSARLLRRWLWHQRAGGEPPLVRRNESSTCCGRNVMVQTVRRSPLGIQEFGHLWKAL